MRPCEPEILAACARAMRLAPTCSESRLWEALRCRRLQGVEFRRQVAVGGKYVADFVAPKQRLVVEVDGEYHASRARADARRDREFARLGYRVLRLPAERVQREFDWALGEIRRALRER